MNASPPPKRIKLDLSPPAPQSDDQRSDSGPETVPGDDEAQQEDQCTICLQPFLDKTMISVCAHEFCFECILLWSEQSRKCPLCARPFDDGYLIHHIRSQYDYQKHYLPPVRSSSPLLTGPSRAHALRHARRERQWGRRQRQQREEADQLERAIARRRWIYQHHLYAKHIASNPYTRYRPFPTPAQFTASPDLIRRMMIFLRRELRVWPNLDVEFLTTYTISLMKSIDIRSESAVKLLSEFLDLDGPYIPGARHVHAEHFVHEIYSYLRSPYRDLSAYDQTVQYDTPPEISQPQALERGHRWAAESSPSRRPRSRSRSRSIPRRENIEGHGQERETRRDRPRERSHKRSAGNISPGQEDSSHRRCNGAQDTFRNAQPESRDMDVPVPSGSSVPIQGNQNGKDTMVESYKVAPTRAAEKTNLLGGGDVAAISEASMTSVMDEPLPRTDDDVHYVGDDLGGSSADTMAPRKSSTGLDVHPRRRTLLAGVRAHLGRPTESGHPAKQRGDGRVGRTDMHGDEHRTLLYRLTDGPGASKKDRLTLDAQR